MLTGVYKTLGVEIERSRDVLNVLGIALGSSSPFLTGTIKTYVNGTMKKH